MHASQSYLLRGFLGRGITESGFILTRFLKTFPVETDSKLCRTKSDFLRTRPVFVTRQKALCRRVACCSSTSRGTVNQSTVTMENGAEPSAIACESQHVDSQEIARGKWIALSEITYKDPTGKERKWETVGRTTKSGRGTDAVVIIPILKRMLKFDYVILVKQYRPPLKAYTLEFPAGLIDNGEDPLNCAVRELKEETGYTCTPKHTSPGVCLDPGLSNSTINMVTVEIDGDEESNRKPVQQQEESEFIQVIPVPKDGLLDALNNYAKDGVIVHSIVYTYAIAMSQMAKPEKVVP